MTSLFAKKPAPKEVMREAKRDISASTRDLDRQIVSMQAEEKKLILEVKRAAKLGNQSATKHLAKEVIRLRAQVARLQGSRAQMRGLSAQTNAMGATMAVAGAVKGAGHAMGAMNAHMNPTLVMQTAQNFQRESGKMDMAQEAMGDALDDSLDGEGIDEESDDLTNEILDEIGIDTRAQLAGVPKTKLQSRAAVQREEDSEEDPLARRLEALRRE